MPLKGFVGSVALQEVLRLECGWVGGQRCPLNLLLLTLWESVPHLGYSGCPFSGDLGPAASLLS